MLDFNAFAVNGLLEFPKRFFRDTVPYLSKNGASDSHNVLIKKHECFH